MPAREGCYAKRAEDLTQSARIIAKVEASVPWIAMLHTLMNDFSTLMGEKVGSREAVHLVLELEAVYLAFELSFGRRQRMAASTAALSRSSPSQNRFNSGRPDALASALDGAVC